MTYIHRTQRTINILQPKLHDTYKSTDPSGEISLVCRIWAQVYDAECKFTLIKATLTINCFVSHDVVDQFVMRMNRTFAEDKMVITRLLLSHSAPWQLAPTLTNTSGPKSQGLMTFKSIRDLVIHSSLCLCPNTTKSRLDREARSPGHIWNCIFTVNLQEMHHGKPFSGMHPLATEIQSPILLLSSL